MPTTPADRHAARLRDARTHPHLVGRVELGDEGTVLHVLRVSAPEVVQLAYGVVVAPGDAGNQDRDGYSESTTVGVSPKDARRLAALLVRAAARVETESPR